MAFHSTYIIIVFSYTLTFHLLNLPLYSWHVNVIIAYTDVIISGQKRYAFKCVGQHYVAETKVQLAMPMTCYYHIYTHFVDACAYRTGPRLMAESSISQRTIIVLLRSFTELCRYDFIQLSSLYIYIHTHTHTPTSLYKTIDYTVIGFLTS